MSLEQPERQDKLREELLAYLQQVEAARGGLAVIESLLRRMRDIAQACAEPDLPPDTRTDLVAQYEQYKRQIDVISRTLSYNGEPLLDGSFSFPMN